MFLVYDSRISGHFKGFLQLFLWFRGVFIAKLLRKENIHLHAAKHRQGASSVLLQYLISVRQTPFWKELMFLSIQFWFTVQHFLHSNTLGKIVNCIFLFFFYLYSWIKWRNYWFILQSFFPLAVNLLFFAIGMLHVTYTPVNFRLKLQIICNPHVACYELYHGGYMLLTDAYVHISSKALECAFHQNQRIALKHFITNVLDYFFPSVYEHRS